MDVFTIKSSRDDCAIEFSERLPEDRTKSIDYFKVTITRCDLFAATKVYAFHSQLTRWFYEMAPHWQGWQGERKWESLEGELSLVTTNDRRGHIAIRAQVRSGLYDDSWLVQAVIFVDAGQLDGLASQATRFFGSED